MPAVSSQIVLESLFVPISAEAPAGESLRYEGTYDRVREARREDDPSLPQGVWTTRLKTADWSAVSALCAGAIEHKSKDLQLAVWLAEAWLQRDGFGGVSPGLKLITGLCERFWENLFPELSHDGAEARIDLIDWMDEVFSRKLRRIPFADATEGTSSYCLADWESGFEVDRAGRRNRASSGDEDLSPGDTRESFLARMSLTDRERWVALQKEVRAGITAAEALEACLVQKMADAPRVRRTKDALSAIQNLVAEGLGMTTEKEPLRPLDERMKESEATREGGTEPLNLVSSTSIGSRADAYRKLSEAAEYLLRTEPHSPVPYLVKRAVSWGNMSLTELLYEFVGSPEDLVTIQRLLGMRGKE